MSSKVIATASPKNLQQVCRLCLSEKYLEDVFDQADLPQWISQYLSIEVSASDEVSKLVCVICSTRIKEFREFQRSCQEVQDVLQKGTSNDPNKNEDQSIRCDVCFNVCQTQKQLSEHKRMAHGLKAHKCLICNEAFLKLADFRGHMQTHHTQKRITLKEQSSVDPGTSRVLRGELQKAEDVIQNEASQSLPKDETPSMKCDVCSNVFQTLKQMIVHRKLVHGRIVCSICGKSFTRLARWREHLNTHSADPFECEICHKEFKVKKQLLDHLRQVHGPKKYVCSICSKAFVLPLGLKNHMATHKNDPALKTITSLHKTVLTGKTESTESAEVPDKAKEISISNGQQTEQNGPIRCNDCGKEFAVRKKLTAHRRNVHGPKSETCSYCGKGFVRRRELEIHMKYHQRDALLASKDYCTICNVFFPSQAAFRQHFRTHEHATEPKKEPSALIETQNSFASSSAMVVLQNDYKLDCGQLTDESKPDITSLQTTLSNNGDEMAQECSDRRSPMDTAIQKVACTICNQLIHPSLDSLTKHLKTHDVAEAEDFSMVVEEIFEAEEIKLEPSTIDDD